MKVQEIMNRNLASTSPTSTLRQAARKMSELNVGSLLVVDDSNNLLGIITDRDISCFAIAMGHDLNWTEVQKIMTKEVFTCFNDQDIGDAAHLMEDKHIRRLVVMDHDNKMTGFLSVDDLARYSHELAGEVLRAATPIH